MRPPQKRLVYVGLAATLIIIFLAGVIAGYIGRTNSICSDHRPPVAQEDTGIGQVFFRCHNGQTVTSND